MSHNISNINGRNEMAYTGEKPWHGLGQELRLGASIEEWITAAGMDWKVKRSKVRYFCDKNGAQQLEWPEQHVLFRSDTQAPLGVVSDHYKVVQPAAVLEFFRDLAVDNRFMLETAGTLKGGAIYWALAKIHEEAELPGGDKLRGYVLLSTSADGSRKTSAKCTSIRVVCNNTLDMADSERGRAEVSVSHRSIFDAQKVKIDLGVARHSFHSFMEQARALAKRKVSRAESAAFTLALLGGDGYREFSPEKREEVLSTKHAQGIATLYAGAGKGAQLTSAKETAWGLVNAVTEYVDHSYPSRTQENRLTSAWFGNGNTLKNRALELAVAMA
jgi:phage/plasmid-like protein (TIGR03299 family)